MASKKDGKLFNDPIHGPIVLHPLLVKIVDTPEFQRLRYIKQLGGAYYVYPGATHNRFEHCIGVSYIAGELVETLREKQSTELDITDQDVLCVRIAGLCHDLGHGPFSHVFDNLFIREILPGQKWKHENASVEMFRHMLKKKEVRDEFEKDEYGLSIEEHGAFIEELIEGNPRENTPQERKIKKRFLYEIVANEQNKIDVDKWDYFARDSYYMNVPGNFDMKRTMHVLRVLKCGGRRVGHTCCEGTTHICVRDNEVYNLYEMFHTRYSLHKRAYQHKVVKGVELMITDALVAADGHLKLSKAIDNMDDYIKLTDDVLQKILWWSDESIECMKKSSEIMQRLQKRDLYKCIVDQPCDEWRRDIPKGCDLRDEFVAALPESERTLSSDDIHILVVTFDYGMKSDNPINSVLFYKKEDQDTAIRIPREEVDCAQQWFPQCCQRPSLSAILECMSKKRGKRKLPNGVLTNGGKNNQRIRMSKSRNSQRRTRNSQRRTKNSRKRLICCRRSLRRQEEHQRRRPHHLYPLMVMEQHVNSIFKN